MQDDRALLTDRARALLLAFSISHNASDFCRFLTVVALRQFEAISSFIIRVEPDGSLKTIGQYGQSRIEAQDMADPQIAAINQAITTNQSVAIDIDIVEGEPRTGFIAIPFNPNGDVSGAFGMTFYRQVGSISLPQAEIELLQLLSELIAVNSLPRIQAAGLLSKLYAGANNIESASAISSRQLTILDEMAIGKTNNQIAKSLNLSESTIKQETVRIFRILGVSSRKQAVFVGKEMGLI